MVITTLPPHALCGMEKSKTGVNNALDQVNIQRVRCLHFASFMLDSPLCYLFGGTYKNAPVGMTR
jgi:hypothetical protein